MNLLVTFRHSSSRPLSVALRALLWHRLRLLHPFALAAVLLPDGLRVVVPAGSTPGTLLETLRCSLEGACRRFGEDPGWRLEPSVSLTGRVELEQAVVEVVATPVEYGASDPAEWLFSTHRDVLGATARPWVSGRRLARALERPSTDFGPRHHLRVMRRLGREPVGPPAFRGPLPHEPLDRLASASSAAVRHVEPEAGTRRDAVDLFLAVGHALGRSTDGLCRYVRVPPRRVRTAMRRATDLGVEATLMCLGDVRLRAAQDVLPLPIGVEWRLHRASG